MPKVFYIILGFAAVFGVLSWMFARWRADADIRAKFNRERLLPHEMDGRLRSLRFRHRLVWFIIVTIAVGAIAVIETLFSDSISFGGFVYNLLFELTSLLHWGYHVVEGVVFGVAFVLCIVLTFMGVGIGVKMAASQYSLSETLPVIAGRHRAA